MKTFIFAAIFLLYSSSVFAGPFKRGDASNDNVINIVDVIFINNFLWVGGQPPICPDAADVNDDGSIDISDPAYLLNFLFLHGTNIPQPGFFVAGVDRTVDNLICWDHSPLLEFKRGDVNQDRVVNGNDLMALSDWILFSGGVGLCPDASDVNDDEVLNGADVTYLNNFLNNSGPVPASPGPFVCGPDDLTNNGALWCANTTICQ